MWICLRTACPQHCKDLSVVVVSDPTRRNGCNWQLAVSTPEGKPDHEFLCLQYIEDDLRLLFSIFDLEEANWHRVGRGAHAVAALQ